MKKGIILLADDFEDLEAIGTIDLLKRAGIQLETVSMNETEEVLSAYKLRVIADKTSDQINLDEYDFLIIPGGPAVVKTHWESEITKEFVEYFNDNQKLIACICAAPSILGKLGLLKQQQFTCFPSFEQYGKDGYYVQDKKVVVSSHYVTSMAAGTVIEFAEAIIQYLKDEETAKKVVKGIYYQ